MIQKLKRIVLAAVTTVIGVLGTTSVALTGMGGQRRGRWGDIRQTMQPGWDQSGASSGNLRQPGDRQILWLCSGAGRLVASRAQLPRKIKASRLPSGMTYLRIVIPLYIIGGSMIPACAGTSLFRKPVSTPAFARACFSGSCPNVAAAALPTHRGRGRPGRAAARRMD